MSLLFSLIFILLDKEEDKEEEEEDKEEEEEQELALVLAMDELIFFYLDYPILEISFFIIRLSFSKYPLSSSVFN